MPRFSETPRRRWGYNQSIRLAFDRLGPEELYAMYALSKPAFWYRFFNEFLCHNCGSREGYVSRPRNLFERYGLRFFFMRTARCGDCYLRSYRPVRVPLMPRPEGLNFDPESMLAATLAAERKVSQEETKDGTESQQRIA